MRSVVGTPQHLQASSLKFIACGEPEPLLSLLSSSSCPGAPP
jgi:hypothetical protein